MSAFSLKILAKFIKLKSSLPKETEHADVGEDFWFCLPSGYLGNNTLGNNCIAEFENGQWKPGKKNSSV